MEHVVQSVIVPCSNTEYGCIEKFTYYQKEEHEKACPNAPCFCPESGCGFVGHTKMLLDHFTTKHKCPLTSLSDSHHTESICIQLGLNVLRYVSETVYFFLLSMTSEPLGYAISVVCIQPEFSDPKFSCTINYDFVTTGYCGSTSCYVRSSSLSDGLPTGYDLILPKGKISDDRYGIILTVKIHEPLSLRRSCSDTDDDGDDLVRKLMMIDF
uniref:Uncharacterized protein n=1 Tax=Avena sativa TaxID=4498 RepID=A0ACD5TSK6_AVESA